MCVGGWSNYVHIISRFKNILIGFMGQTLSEPVTTKETACCANALYKVGSSCMQGWRISMEDAHTHLLAVPDDNTASFFAVYDGHGGSKVSQYAGMHLHKLIVTNSAYAEGNIEDGIKEGFLAIDDKMKSDDEMKDDVSGATAVVVIIKDNKIYCGNVGDSRAVACVSGEARPLSFDHKPANDNESKRISAAGGWVEFNRVNGNLALSRALGDFAFKCNEEKSAKEQIVTAFPDVTVNELTADHEFVVLACDGIWDVMSNQEVVDFCRKRLAAGDEPEKICEELLSQCLAPDCQMGGIGCDNMTVVLVCLLQNQNYSSFKARCSKPAKICAQNLQNAEANTDDEFATPEVSPVKNQPVVTCDTDTVHICEVSEDIRPLAPENDARVELSGTEKETETHLDNANSVPSGPEGDSVCEKFPHASQTENVVGS